MDIMHDVIENILMSSGGKGDYFDTHWRMMGDDEGLHFEYIGLINAEEEILKQLDFYNSYQIENQNTIDTVAFLKEKKVNFIYYYIGENAIRKYIIQMLSQWRKTSQIKKMKYINIKFEAEENLTCLVTASKSKIDTIVEQQILETKHDFAEDTNLLEAKKYQFDKAITKEKGDLVDRV